MICFTTSKLCRDMQLAFSCFFFRIASNGVCSIVTVRGVSHQLNYATMKRMNHSRHIENWVCKCGVGKMKIVPNAGMLNPPEKCQRNYFLNTTENRSAWKVNEPNETFKLKVFGSINYMPLGNWRCMISISLFIGTFNWKLADLLTEEYCASSHPKRRRKKKQRAKWNYLNAGEHISSANDLIQSYRWNTKSNCTFINWHKLPHGDTGKLEHDMLLMPLRATGIMYAW